jgi:AcrR family transcriptional regulator
MPGQNAKANVLFYSIGVFAKKGIAETTVQDLLEAANVSRRTFYKYFKNKVDVLESIYEIASNMLITRFREEMGQASVADFVVRCVGLYFDYHTTLGPLVRMMTEEARRSDSPLAQHREKTIDHLVHLFDEKYFEKVGLRIDLGHGKRQPQSADQHEMHPRRRRALQECHGRYRRPRHGQQPGRNHSVAASGVRHNGLIRVPAIENVE